MIRFTCPRCDKGLRADDSKAGSIAKCPSCGHKVSIPCPDADPAPPEDAEPGDAEAEQPAPRRKRKRLRRKATETDRGRRFVIAIICLVLGMHLMGAIYYLATPDPLKAVQKQTPGLFKDPGQDLPKDLDKKLELDLKRMEGQMQNALRWGKLMGLVVLIGRFALDAVLLTFLYLRHDWARLVLGVLSLLGGLFGLYGLVMGGLTLLRLLTTGAAIMLLLEMLVGLGVSFGVGVALLKSEDIAAYTAGG